MKRPREGWELVRGTQGYPSCLEQSPAPPEVLFGIGDKALLRRGLAVVGSRRATPYGLACARMFAGWAAEQGVVIISGAAMGCDHEAHRAALKAGGNTVAVLGCGADVDYPRGGRHLLEEVRMRGAVVAEVPWGTLPAAFAFPRRNRIIAALAAVVLVVEAGLPSGTFSTADHALDAGREVVAVPGSIFFENSRGCNRLIRQGARPIIDVSDLAHELADAGVIERADRKESDASVRISALDPQTRPLAAALLANPMRPDEAARELQYDIVTLTRLLTRLESQGVIARYPDGRYGACGKRC